MDLRATQSVQPPGCSVWLGVRGEGRGATGAPGFLACVTGQLVTERGRSTGRCFGL